MRKQSCSYLGSECGVSLHEFIHHAQRQKHRVVLILTKDLKDTIECFRYDTERRIVQSQ